jgi:hypothetical protein
MRVLAVSLVVFALSSGCFGQTRTGGAGGAGGGSTAGAVLLGPTTSQTIQPTSGSNIIPLAIAPATGVTQTADLFDVWKDSAMTTKAVWVDASGNLNFLGNSATYGAPSQSTQSFLRLYGSTANTSLAPPYFDLEKTDGSIKSFLAPSTSINGLVCVSSTAPGGDCAAGTTLASNPMTAAGDLIIGGTPNSLGIAPPTRLALGTSGQCLQSNGTTVVYGACGTGSPGGANTQVQFNNSGAFGGSANFTWNNTSNTLTVNGTVTATSFQTTGAGAGQTSWTTGTMTTALAGQVTCGANTGNIFSCSDSTGPIYPVAFLNDGGDLGGAQGAERVTGLHFGTTGIALASTAPASGQFLQYNGTNIVGAAALANPMTAAGDIIVGGTGGSPTRLGLGTSGQCLQSNGTTVVYGACGSTSTATALQFGTNAAIALSSTNPTSGQCLTYNGTNVAGGSCGTGPTLYLWQPFPNASVSNLSLRTNGVSVSAIPVIAAGTVSFSYVDISVATADTTSTDLYSVGIYGPCAPNSASCPAVVTTKAQALTTSGFVEFGPSQINQTTPITLTPPPSGQYYYIAWTGNATTALLDSPNGRSFSPVCNVYSGNTTSGGQMPTSISIPAASWINGCAMPIFALHN